MTWLLIAAIFCLCQFLAVNSVWAGPQPPVHRLRISFDLSESLLIASSIIELPGNIETEVLFAGLTINSITLDGKPVTLAPDQKTLKINTSPTPRNLTIEYTKHFSSVDNGSGSIINQKGITLTGIWHPRLAEKAFFELTATVPSDFEAVAEADNIENISTATGKEFRFLFPHSLADLTFIAGPYEVQKSRFGTNKDIYTYFFNEDHELAASYLEKAIIYLERYEKLIGPYPFQRFAVVEDQLASGFAVPTMTLLGQAVVRLPFITETSLGHEALHSWFGINVETSDKSGNWSEGLTTYLADHLYAQDSGKDTMFRKDQIIKYLSYVNESNAIALKQFTSAQGFSADQQARRAVGYAKSCMLFHMLKNKLGDELFIKGIKEFYQLMSSKAAGWEDIIQSFETVSNQNLHDFFSQWLDRIDIPHLQADKLKTEEKDGQSVLSFNLIQHNEKPYSLAVPIKVVTLQGDISTIVYCSTPETPVEIKLPATALELVLDPNYDLIRQLEPDETPAVWSAFMGDRETLAVVAPGATAEIFPPMIRSLENMGTIIAGPDEITDTEIAQNSTIFIDAAIPTARALFAEPRHPSTGLTLDLRRNPLNPDHLAILVSANSREEVGATIGKLVHYGKYSFLHFEAGKLLEKRPGEAKDGARYALNLPPVGIETRQSITYSDILKKLADKKVVYVGEEHTRYEDHQLQLQVIRGLYAQNPKLSIGMEMFHKADQQTIDDYIAAKIDETTFLRQSKYFEKWGFDYRYYRDIINFARINRLPVIALNLDKQIVSKVYKENGVSALTAQEKEAIPENRDLDVPGYQNRIAGVYKNHRQDPQEPDRFKAFLQSQALWDETMAETIATYLTAHPEERMVVIAGQGHVVKNDAIPPRVARRLAVDQAIIVNAADKEIDAALADFLVFLTPAELPPPALLGVILKEDNGNVIVEKLSPHGGANLAGIKEKDMIVALDDHEIKVIADLKLLLLYKKIGEKVNVRIKRPRTFLADKVIVIEVGL